MKFSIVIPVHNRVELLGEALNSILHEHLNSYEIIVCDDGSTEDVEALCAGFELSANELKFSRTAGSHGAQVARNRGLSLAKGDFVMFMDSDDVLAEEGVSLLLGALQADPDLQYVYGKVSRTDELLELLPGDVPVGSSFTDIPSEVAGYHWHTMGALYRRSYLEGVGPWNVEMTGSQDWEYQARVKLAGGKGRFVDVTVGYWRQHGGERVGAATFRPDYVRSVMIGCSSILRKAREAKRCDAVLEKRLAKRLIVHALEWGTNGRWHDRKICLLQARDGISSHFIFRFGLTMMAYTPAIFDRMLLERIASRRTS